MLNYVINPPSRTYHSQFDEKRLNGDNHRKARPALTLGTGPNDYTILNTASEFELKN